MDGNHIEPVKKVFPKVIFFHQLLERFVGGTNNPHISLDGTSTVHSLEGLPPEGVKERLEPAGERRQFHPGTGCLCPPFQKSLFTWW